MLHPAKGSIAEFFLDAGFASYVDWSAQNCASGADKLKDCQKKAQEGKRGRKAQGLVRRRRRRGSEVGRRRRRRGSGVGVLGAWSGI